MLRGGPEITPATGTSFWRAHRVSRAGSATTAAPATLVCADTRTADAEGSPGRSVSCRSYFWPVTYIQAPPTPDTTPDQVLKYLARYMTGGPISDRRLVAHENGHVTFRARTGTQPGGSDETEEVRLPGAEFVRRWALHILPKGYTKTRRYGGYSNPHRQRYMTECRKLLATGEPSQETESATSVAADPQQYRCPNCESLLACTHSTERPGWSTVMSTSHRPSWYRNDWHRPIRYNEAGANEAWYNDG